MAHPPSILVVDDDTSVVRLMQSLLHELGFESATATRGAEAVEAARRTRPGLVLLDMNMPGMSGEEVIGAFRADPDLAPVPIIILSGKPVDAAALQRLGANAAVLKPFDLNELVRTIRSHMGYQ